MQQAITSMNISVGMLEQDSRVLHHHRNEYWDCRRYLAEWYRDLGRNKESLDHYNALLENNPEDYDLLPPLFRIMLESKQFDDALALIRKIKDTKLKSGHSRLAHAVMALSSDECDFQLDLIDTAARMGELELMRRTHDEALSEALRKHKTGLAAMIQYYQGCTLERYLDKRDEAIA